MLSLAKMEKLEPTLSQYEKKFGPNGLGTYMVIDNVDLAYLKEKLQQGIDTGVPIASNDTKIYPVLEEGELI